MREGDNSSRAEAGRIKQGLGTGPGLWKVPSELMFRKAGGLGRPGGLKADVREKKGSGRPLGLWLYGKERVVLY